MFSRLKFTLFALPLIEIALFVVIGGRIGLWATFGVIFGTAILGGWVISRQKQRAVSMFQTRRAPLSDISFGILDVFAGVLLMLPGFFTDFLGLLLLLPPIRHWLIGYMRAYVPNVKTADTGYVDATYQDVTDHQPPSDRPHLTRANLPRANPPRD